MRPHVRYQTLVKKVREALTGSKWQRYRADKKPENWKRFFDRLLEVNLLPRFWTAGNTLLMRD